MNYILKVKFMKNEELFKIDTILSEDVLGQDTLSLVLGGNGGIGPVCPHVIYQCPSNCSPNICTKYIIVTP